jgi:hypothetical protein
MPVSVSPTSVHSRPPANHMFCVLRLPPSCPQCVPGEACHPLDVTWRICVAIGAVPAIATWYLRTRLPETPRYTVHVAQVRLWGVAWGYGVCYGWGPILTRESFFLQGICF